MVEPILKVAIPCPLYRTFDYLPPLGQGELIWQPGQRLLLPFRSRETVGVLIEVVKEAVVPREQLKRVTQVLDKTSLFTPDAWDLILWAASYYHYPIGEAIATAIPSLLRRGAPAQRQQEHRWHLTEAGQTTDPATLARAKKQLSLLRLLKEHPLGLTPGQLVGVGGDWRNSMKRLQTQGLVSQALATAPRPTPRDPVCGQTPPPLSPEQATALDALNADQGKGFVASLLDGVTGSGKTEVYLRLIERVLETGAQVLVLVPEIGLTPQLAQRLRARFDVPMALYHSGLTEKQRLETWLQAREGYASLLVGTRSAVFLPMANPGLILVDEEHDASFKQHEGMHYSARDLAVWRARRLNILVILGSATPSLESLHNAQRGRYHHLHLRQRVGEARLPKLQLVDMRAVRAPAGLSPQLITSIQQHLATDGQILLFRNRRGYAPILRCHGCGWIASCPHCDAHYTLHIRGKNVSHTELICHHCEHRASPPLSCPSCSGLDLQALGYGTVRLEQALNQQFPDAIIARLDRDTAQSRDALPTILDAVHARKVHILIGTQMLAKGHDFPGVTLAGVMDADQGLFSVDFRAGERLAQTITQVAGRAGRAEKPGEVLIQTHQPQHPLLQTLVRHDYHRFAELALTQRNQAGWPPFSRLALVRAEAINEADVMAFLAAAKASVSDNKDTRLMVLGPVPAPMSRRAGRHRAQLLIQATTTHPIHELLRRLIPNLSEHVLARRVRWSVDVDPHELF